MKQTYRTIKRKQAMCVCVGKLEHIWCSVRFRWFTKHSRFVAARDM